jgi:hypothetical protein
MIKEMAYMELTYSREGDYLIPDLTLPEDGATFGKYGMLRKTFLKEHRKGMYASLMLSGKLNSHLAEIDRTARERVELITSQMLQINPPPDKATDQMAWVGHMNNLRHSAEETVLEELIYN